jgi:hypothetical protein
MDAAERLAPEETEPLAWSEICTRYPAQYVCLVDVDRDELGSPVIKTARVVGHGPTRKAAFEPVSSIDRRHRRFAVRFTGICTEPLVRPSLVIDDEDLEILRS